MAALVAAPGQAHHSSAIYESERTVTLTGEVREFQWTNPHCWIQVIVPGADGDEEWSVEMAAPLQVYQAGWKPSTLQPSRFPPMLSDQAHFTERLRMVSQDRFEDDLTVEDPVALTQPWKITIPYERVTDLDRMVHGLCDENDRNPVVDGKLTVASPED